MIRALAEDEAQTALLADDRTVFVAAFDGETPVGFAFGYVLPRRHGRPTIFFVYELDVDERYRRQGIGRRLMEELLFGQEEAFVLTDAGQRGGDGALRVARRHARRLGDVGLLSYRAATDDDVALLVELARRSGGLEVLGRRDVHRATRCASGSRVRTSTCGSSRTDGEPVGLLQSWWEPIHRSAAGSTASSIPSARGRGIMPAVARQLASDLLGAGLGGGDRRPVRVERARGPRAGRRPASSRFRAATRRTRITRRDAWVSACGVCTG